MNIFAYDVCDNIQRWYVFVNYNRYRPNYTKGLKNVSQCQFDSYLFMALLFIDRTQHVEYWNVIPIFIGNNRGIVRQTVLISFESGIKRL